jgi:hypothetical protein
LKVVAKELEDGADVLVGIRDDAVQYVREDANKTAKL